MSSSNYKSSLDRDLFSVEADDVDDDIFLRQPKSSSSTYSNSAPMNLEERRQQLFEKKKEIEERSLMSTERSLNYLRNSEEVGIVAAEELLRQREKLERTERSLDNINTTLRFSQKHIQGIKSVFGGLKNFFGGKMNGNIPEGNISRDTEDKNATHLNQAITDLTFTDKSPSNDDHAGLRIRGLVEQEAQAPLDHQQRIDRNLDEMLGSISKLKGLAHGLGEEIESHNTLIENVITKTERADDSLKRQNKSIKRLLQ